MANEQPKWRRIAAWALIGTLSALFAVSAAAKLAGVEPLLESFALWGLEGKHVLIGIGELTAGVLYLIPRTSSLGVLVLSAHMGGAIMVHMSHGESYILQSAILVLVWVGAYLRNPELMSSFTHKRIAGE